MHKTLYFRSWLLRALYQNSTILNQNVPPAGQLYSQVSLSCASSFMVMFQLHHFMVMFQSLFKAMSQFRHFLRGYDLLVPLIHEYGLVAPLYSWLCLICATSFKTMSQFKTFIHGYGQLRLHFIHDYVLLGHFLRGYVLLAQFIHEYALVAPLYSWLCLICATSFKTMSQFRTFIHGYVLVAPLSSQLCLSWATSFVVMSQLRR